MHNQELDYEIPFRPLCWAWLLLSSVAVLAGLWHYGILVMLLLTTAALLWINLYTTILHYALDAEEFLKLPVVGTAFIRFQSHHFPQWINVIYRKPVMDLIGELNPVAVLTLFIAALFYRMHSVGPFVAWGVLMLVSGYAMLGHRWAHEPPTTKPRIANHLQKYRLSLSPTAHWQHHEQAVQPEHGMVQNYDLSFGWSNGIFNHMVRVIPSPRVWLGFILVAGMAQVPAFILLLRWMHR